MYHDLSLSLSLFLGRVNGIQVTWSEKKSFTAITSENT